MPCLDMSSSSSGKPLEPAGNTLQSTARSRQAIFQFQGSEPECPRSPITRPRSSKTNGKLNMPLSRLWGAQGGSSGRSTRAGGRYGPHEGAPAHGGRGAIAGAGGAHPTGGKHFETIWDGGAGHDGTNGGGDEAEGRQPYGGAGRQASAGGAHPTGTSISATRNGAETVAPTSPTP